MLRIVGGVTNGRLAVGLRSTGDSSAAVFRLREQPTGGLLLVQRRPYASHGHDHAEDPKIERKPDHYR